MSKAKARGIEGMPRSDIVKAGIMVVICSSAALAVYYLVPLAHKPYGAVWWRLAVALALFSAVLVHEMGSISRHAQPMHRAVIALSVLLPLFVVMFSWIYLSMSRSNPANFGGAMTRTEALYFTITVLSTVGFGDIVPRTDPARLTVSVQMVSDLILIAVVVRLIFDVASRAAARQRVAAPPNHEDR